MMWNLVMNLPGKLGYNMEPFIHRFSNEGEWIEEMFNDDSEYDNKRNDDSFSGQKPFEASGMYNERLKSTILRCTEYRQHDIWSFAQLKSVTKEWAGKAPPPDSKALGNLIIRVSEEMDQFVVGKTYKSKRRRA
jgi:hypothetical protein